MAEKNQRATVVKGLKHLHAKPVENSVGGSGTPDVNCIPGWIELKWLRAWPKNEDTVVRLDHYTNQQRLWLRKRWECGGGAWLLLQCRREWLLFNAPEAQEVGRLTRLELYEACTAYWDNGFHGKELGECLIRESLTASRLANGGCSNVAA